MLEMGEIRCPTHLYIGQEGVAVGVCSALRKDDYVFGNHRSHGHYLAKGGDMAKLMAELYCKATGCSKGRGGSMHIIAPEVGVLGTVPMVASTIPIAVGSALASVLKGIDRISVTFFGDGATEEGLFHESLNFASLKKLPVVFICENNFYSSHLPLHERRSLDSIYMFGLPYGIPSKRIDGNDVLAVYFAMREAVKHARKGEGPTLLECRTYRWRGHVGPKWDLDVGIRDKAELDYWMSRCPIKTLERRIVNDGLLSYEDCTNIKREVKQEVEKCVDFARQSPEPSEDDLLKHVFIDRRDS